MDFASGFLGLKLELDKGRLVDVRESGWSIYLYIL